MIGADELAKMKPGVVIVNCARGDLIDNDALIAAVEDNHIGAAALDTLESEDSYMHKDLPVGAVTDHRLAVLNWFPNVIVTPHIAFFTQTAVSQMVESSLNNLISFVETGRSDHEVTG